MSAKYLLGIDLGSGGLKTTLLSTEGKVVITMNKEYLTYYPHVSWAEQDPQDWYEAFKVSFKEMINKTGISPKDIIAVAPDAATHTAVLMDEDLTPIRRAILWTDQRSSKQSAQLKTEYRKLIFDLTYQSPDPMWTLPQLMWVKENEPTIWQRVRRILFAKDYFRYQLTGKYVTDYIEALGSMLFDAKKREWSKELCAIVGFPIENLPSIVSPTDVVGTVTKSAAQDTGLSEETLVIAGASDTALEVFCAGAVETGQATVKLATAGRICLVSDHPYPHPFILNYNHVVPGKWYPGTGTKSSASSYRWYRDVFCDYEKNMVGKTGKDPYQMMDQAAAEVMVGCEGLFFHPYLLGELTPYGDPLLRGSFTGISMYHTKAHFTRAVLEGVAFSLRDCLDVVREMGEIKEARIIGGGSCSPLWRQIVSDVLGLEVIKPVIDDSSFGAALLAGVGVGAFKSFNEAVNKCVRIHSVIKPNANNHEKYEKLFQIYREIHSSLEETYHTLDKLMTSPKMS